MIKTGHYYDVISYTGTSGLRIIHNDQIEDVISDINGIVKQAKEAGWNRDEKWIIIDIAWGRTFDKDGRFTSSWENRTAIALYDNGNVTYL